MLGTIGNAPTGAAANALPNPVAESVKQERYHRFMQKQQAISTQKLSQRVGQQLTVLVESAAQQGFVARSYADAPEIDGLVHIDTEQDLTVGEFYRVEVTAADEYDLYASLDIASASRKMTPDRCD